MARNSWLQRRLPTYRCIENSDNMRNMALWQKSGNAPIKIAVVAFRADYDHERSDLVQMMGCARQNTILLKVIGDSIECIDGPPDFAWALAACAQTKQYKTKNEQSSG